MKFTLHTEPSVNPPEFTIIICTEVGPATHLVWQGPNGRVQEDGDHEMSQVIVDTSQNSVYENRLRVRGRENGMYTCIFINNINDYLPRTFLDNLLYVSLSIMGMYKHCTITLHKLIKYTFSLQLLKNPPVSLPFLSLTLSL